jgi:hypothetical protein
MTFPSAVGHRSAAKSRVGMEINSTFKRPM